MEKILHHLKKNQIIQQMIHHVQNNENIYINNTNEANALLVLLSLFQSTNKTFFIITPNIYTAQLVYDQLSKVMNKDLINFYPQDEFLSNELLVSSNEFRLERINTIDKIINEKPRIVVTNLYGILKPQFEKNKWLESFIKIEKGGIYPIEFLKERLINYGYNHQYTVE